MARISDVLRRKGSTVATIRPDEPVSRLLALLAEHNIGAVVVVDADDVVGMVSERDVVRGVHASGNDLLARPVAEIMSSTVTSCGPDDEVDNLMAIMTDGRFRHVPVVVEGRLSGLVSIGDLVKARIGELEEEREHLHSYLAAGS
jgi:CBS domain-containing protein